MDSIWNSWNYAEYVEFTLNLWGSVKYTPHLKRRGVQNIFHSLLLWEHVPNNNRLFPEWLYTQLGNTPETEGEWTVEQVLSQAGAGTDSVFEIKGSLHIAI